MEVFAPKLALCQKCVLGVGSLKEGRAHMSPPKPHPKCTAPLYYQTVFIAGTSAYRLVRTLCEYIPYLHPCISALLWVSISHTAGFSFIHMPVRYSHAARIPNTRTPQSTAGSKRIQRALPAKHAVHLGAGQQAEGGCRAGGLGGGGCACTQDIQP